MKAKRSRISNVIGEHMLELGVTKDYSLEIAAYLISERRTKELNSILRDIQSNWVQHGYIDVNALSAHSLNNQEKQEIINIMKKYYPKANKINVSEELNPELIGGVKLILSEQQLDLSVSGKLNEFKNIVMNRKD
jgi:ATP synthase F1 delta subunit